MTVARGFEVWEGVYRSFAEAQASGPGFDGDVWRERSLKSALEAIAQAETGAPIEYSSRQRNALLPVIAATVLRERERVSILDFGGGLGTGFIVLAATVPEARARADYRIVEIDGICRAGRALFAGKPGPLFLDELPADGRFDLVHAASAIQYVEDWRGIVQRLASYQATYLTFSDIFVGRFESFVTLQNYHGSRIRHWFLNLREFVGEVERTGYRLALKSDCSVKILDVHGPLPMDHFPAELRIPSSSHLLFCRRPTGA
jgi:putative methyltransferase (TIGR04325 family)